MYTKFHIIQLTMAELAHTRSKPKIWTSVILTFMQLERFTQISYGK